MRSAFFGLARLIFGILAKILDEIEETVLMASDNMLKYSLSKDDISKIRTGFSGI